MPTPTCTGCSVSAQLMQLSWQLGSIRELEIRNGVLLEGIRDTLRTSSPAPTPPADRSPWLRELVERAELVPRAIGAAVAIWRLWRTVSWPASVGMWGALAARWLGWL
jgi:hypothetical protein